MRLTVSSIPADGIEERLRLPISLNDVVLEGDVQTFLKASKVGDNVLVGGYVSSVALLICSRCLKKFSFPLKINFNVEYVPSGSISEADEYELTKKELDVGFYQNDEIDIENLVREQILLAVPMKPLCKSDCEGICPKCGKDLNEMSCGCSSDDIDSRLAPLKKLKESLKKDDTKK